MTLGQKMADFSAEACKELPTKVGSVLSHSYSISM